MFKTKLSSRKEVFKTIRTVTEEQEHTCRDDCFKPSRKQTPRGLRRVSLGYIYQDSLGRFYHEWGKDDWLEVTGVEFVEGPGGLHLMFIPREQLHIHSRGGRTIARITNQYDDPGNEHYHAEAASKILRQKNRSLRETRDFLAAKASEIIPRAPKTKKPTSGRGRGAPGVPRSARGRRIVALINDGKSKLQVISETIEWAKKRGENVAGPYSSAIKRHVHRLWQKTNSSHK